MRSGRKSKAAPTTTSNGGSRPEQSGARRAPAVTSEPAPRLTSVRAAALGGSVAMLIFASLLSAALAYTAKEACRAGAWNNPVAQFQAHCYTDIYPIYWADGLVDGKVPYLDHSF